MKDFMDICSYFRVARQNTNTAQAYCPVHAGGREKNPSLTLSRGNDGRTLIFCHVCRKEGTPGILAEVGLTMTDIMPERKQRRKTLKAFAEWEGDKGQYKGARFVDSYDYSNEHGYAYTKCRVALPDGGKTFRYCTTDAECYVEEFRVPNRKEYLALYKFWTLRKTREDNGIVLYVEGEKDVNNAAKDGFHAVTAGAAGDWTKGLTKHFEGLRVVVVPDRDKPGYESAVTVAEDMAAAGIDVRVICWPESFTVEKGDYSDFIDTFEDRAEGVAAFRDLINNSITLSEFRELLQQEDTQPEPGAGDITPEESEARNVAVKIREIEGGKLFAVTDLKVGQLLGTIFVRNRYNVTAKSWYFFDGKRWTLDAEGMQIEKAAAVMTDALWLYSLFYCGEDAGAEDLLKFRQAIGALSKRARRVAAIADARKVRAFSSEDLDRDPDLFNCLNGVLNLRTLQLLPHSPDFLISKVAGVEYRPEANRPDFPEFISQIMMNDRDKITFLQTFAGYLLTGRPVEECFLILYGATTRNGKGTFCETLLRLFGDYGASIRPESLAVKKARDGSAASDDIARLAGIRFLNCSEPAKGLHLDEALVKSLTGGDKITARHLFERFFEFYPQFTMIWNVNFLPVVNDNTIFTSGRVLVLPFERHFTDSEQDRGLKQRLQEPENLSSVLNWAIEGLRRYHSEGLQRPSSVIAATDDYADDSDKIKRFWNDELEECAGAAEKGADVYERFKSWCTASGLFAEAKQNFFQLLRGRGLLQKTGTVRGISLYNVVPNYQLIDRDYEDATGVDIPIDWQ